jgi:hypothetical protein
MNGNFETGALLPYWEGWFAIIDSSIKHGGDYSASQEHGSQMYQTLPTPVQYYQFESLTFWYKLPVNGYLTVVLKDDEGNVVYVGGDVGLHDWTEFVIHVGDLNPYYSNVKLINFWYQVTDIPINARGNVDDVSLISNEIVISVLTEEATDLVLPERATLHGKVTFIGEVNVTKVGFDYKYDDEEDWISVVADVTEITSPYSFSNHTLNARMYRKMSYRAKAFAFNKWFHGWVEYAYNHGPIARVESVLVQQTYLKGVRSAVWNDSDPFVQIPIPAGDMLHHHLKPNMIEGTIICFDVASIWTAFYGGESPIIDEDTGEKIKFSTDGTEFVIVLKDILGNDLTFNFHDVRINTIQMVSPELESGGEGSWVIRFTARLVVKS